MSRIKIDVECGKCGAITRSVSIEISESTIQETNEIERRTTVSDQQRKCSSCKSYWNNISIFRNKANQIELAIGEE
ncbi:MAG: hypothetical protein IKH02_06810 [Prevotella sp.]|nr:hypothetical protein [Prevotella sp.]MBR3088714.1 hypothetical protein [Prevotella sp.]